MINNFLKSKYVVLSSAALVSSLVVPTRVLAQEVEFAVNSEFVGAVSQWYNIAIGLIIISAVVMIIVGGYTLVFSAGNPGIVARGKKHIYNAIIGLVVALLSFVFLNFINPAIFNVPTA